MDSGLQVALGCIPEGSRLRRMPSSALATVVEALGGIFAAELAEALKGAHDDA